MQQLLAQPTVLEGHEAPVKLVALSADGRTLASADTERTVKVWRDGVEIMSKSLRAWHDRFLALDRIRAMAFQGDRLYVASGETVKAFEVPNDEPVWEYGRLPTFAFLITCPQWIAVSSLTEWAATYDDGVVEVHSEERRVVWSDNDSPKTMSYLPDGKRLVGTDYVSVCIWDTATGAKLMKFKPRHKVYALAASPLVDLVATRSLHAVELWDTATGQCRASIPSRPGLPTLCFHPRLDLLVVGDVGGFSVHGLDGVEHLRIDTEGFGPLSFAFNGNDLYVGCTDCVVRRWDLAGL